MLTPPRNLPSLDELMNDEKTASAMRQHAVGNVLRLMGAPLRPRGWGEGGSDDTGDSSV